MGKITSKKPSAGDKSSTRHSPPSSNAWVLAVFVVVLVVALISIWGHRQKSGQVAAADQSPMSQTKLAGGAKFLPTVVNSATAPDSTPAGMAWIPGGEFSMGANDPPDMDEVGMKATEDARPIHRVYVDGFFMDKTDVTNAEFAKFVKATGYVTIAERKPRAEDFPEAPPEKLVAGSVVFKAPDHPVPLDNHLQWWTYVPGANWRHPNGPGSNIKGKDDYPVVHIRLSGCRSLCEVGRQTTADRGGVGVRRARRPDRKTLRVGRLVPAGWKVDGEHASGKFPEL